MLTLDDLARIALDLPDVEEGERHGNRTWSVAGKTFAWERPLTKADVRRFGQAVPPVVPPSGAIVAVVVDDLGEKQAVLAAGHRGFFDMEHFFGYPAVLIQLSMAGKRDVKEALLDGWLSVAPVALAEGYLGRRRRNS